MATCAVCGESLPGFWRWGKKRIALHAADLQVGVNLLKHVEIWFSGLPEPHPEFRPVDQIRRLLDEGESMIHVMHDRAHGRRNYIAGRLVQLPSLSELNQWRHAVNEVATFFARDRQAFESYCSTLASEQRRLVNSMLIAGALPIVNRHELDHGQRRAGRFLRVSRMAATMGDLRARYPEPWRLGESMAESHFEELTLSPRAPTDIDRKQYIQHATHEAIEEFGRQLPLANITGEPILLPEDVVKAFGIAFGTRLTDLLEGRSSASVAPAAGPGYFERESGARATGPAVVHCWCCKASLEVKDEVRGRKVKCPSCGTKQVMPL